LRPLARDLHVSTYSLVYWFGSKEGVVSAALERSQERQQAMVVRFAEELGEIAPGAIFRRYWRWSRSPEGLRYVRLFVELLGLAQRSPQVRRYVDQAIQPWRELLTAVLRNTGLDARRASERATLMSATIAGLQADLSLRPSGRDLAAAAEALADELDALGTLPLDAPVPAPFGQQ
jgi:AcrR family transcriptional regulator